ncbi:flagellar hook-associated protein FlgK [Shewanella sp. C32]|uniref:Flagellar hook-associated protein 1 n=1 Tax=Shewanella electrica TaxID=515560 RepID=A0ABT2FMJ8_9GAMM|nr:flagellar hook-associated protein FlgK [Shewanella electrica]MCH1924558.1 flagellar hook-associated protein FlgK [Shewanella electrica]MCS4556459.1 flagellar hook-associated protein FlgK [Shewanella electrica]
MAIDLLNIARSGVVAAQGQLGVTSNNIANVNTTGYSRQVATQVTDDSYAFGGNYYGTGTYVNDVKRIYNEFAARELRISQTSLSNAETMNGKLNELDELFSQTGVSIPRSLDDFFESMNSLADLPNDSGIRQSLLTSANQLVSSFNQMHSYLDSHMNQVNDEIGSVTTRINEISQEMANINLELMKTQNADPQLLDKQDSLIEELSQYAEVNVVPNDNGTRSIMFGSSFMLVSGEVAMKLGTANGDPYPTEIDLTYTLGNSTLKVDPSKIGGRLGALFDFRENVLQPASQQLGLMALGVSDTFNQAQSQGFDLSGALGSPIFTEINDPSYAASRAAASKNNTGTAVLSVDLTDVGQLTGNSYELRYTAAGNYQLQDMQTGDTTNLTLNGSVLEGADGFAINIDAGAMVAGDRFEIRPTNGAAGKIKSLISEPSQIAAAGPRIVADAANSGNTSISLQNIDRTAAGFPTTSNQITVAIDSSTATPTYEVFDAAGNSLATGSATGSPPQITTNGFTFQLDSTSGATDRFTFDLSFSSGDGANAVNMAALSNNKLMKDGKSTLTDVYQSNKLNIGSLTKSSQVRMDSAQSIYDQAYNRVQSESGVNLDEEAANLMKFQQAYQASARVMSAANTIFDTLLNAVQ